jgi:hypothetical protein
VGVETARMAQRLLPKRPKYPIRDYVPENSCKPELARLYGVKIPEDLLRKAGKKVRI